MKRTEVYLMSACQGLADVETLGVRRQAKSSIAISMWPLAKSHLLSFIELQSPNPVTP